MAGVRNVLNTLIDESLAFLPTPVAQHLTNSKKELLLAIRSPGRGAEVERHPLGEGAGVEGEAVTGTCRSREEVRARYSQRLKRVAT